MEQKGGGGAAGERGRDEEKENRMGPRGQAEREEPTPRVLALLLTDSTFSGITSWSARLVCSLRHTAAESHSSWKTVKWAHANATCCWRGQGKLYRDDQCERRLWAVAGCVNCHLYCTPHEQFKIIELQNRLDKSMNKDWLCYLLADLGHNKCSLFV